MRTKLTFKQIKENYQLEFAVSITSILFLIGLYSHNLSDIILSTLLFLILLEFVRTICEFVFNKEHTIRVVYGIDAAILFGIRELFTGWILMKTDLVEAFILITTSVVLIAFLLIFRKYAQDFRIYPMNNNPDNSSAIKSTTNKG